MKTKTEIMQGLMAKLALAWAAYVKADGGSDDTLKTSTYDKWEETIIKINVLKKLSRGYFTHEMLDKMSKEAEAKLEGKGA